MNERIANIICKLLAVLHAMPDGQCAEPVLRSSVDLLVKPNTLASEFTDALGEAETNGWIIGIRPKLGSVKWSITDTGHAEYLKTR